MSNELSEMDVNDELSDEEHQEIMFVKVLKAVTGVCDLCEEKGQHHHQGPRREDLGEREALSAVLQALDQENDDVDPYEPYPIQEAREV
jgi:hypothetical protein